MSFDVSAVSDYATDLIAAAVKITPAMSDGLGEAARSIADDARNLAPVLTGELVGSISVRGGGLRQAIIATSDHAVYQEFGTSKMAPHPFMEPAAQVGEPKLALSASDAIDQAVRGL